MLKSLYRCVILRKLDNGIIVSVRKFNQKMDEKNHKRQQNNFNDGNNSLNRFRKWVQIALEPQQPGFAFSLLSYNILSQQLLETHSYLYRDHQSQALQWRGRFYNIIGEILCYQPDIFCCQVSCAIRTGRTSRKSIFVSFKHPGSSEDSLARHSNEIKIDEL